MADGGEGVNTMVCILSGGDSRIEAPFRVHQNRSRPYPIRKVPGNIDGDCYQYGSKRWIDRKIFRDWHRETCAVRHCHIVQNEHCTWITAVDME